MGSSHIPQLFLVIGLIIAGAQIAGAAARAIGQPRVFGELLVGIVLGPTLLNMLHWDFLAEPELLAVTIEELAELGVLFLMFTVGLEVHLRELLEVDWPILGLSARTGRHMEDFQRAVVDTLEVIRVYAKPPGKPPDMNAPFIMKRGSTVADVAAKIHRAFLETLKSARIWGSGEFDGQIVSRDHVLQDGDVVELHVQG